MVTLDFPFAKDVQCDVSKAKSDTCFRNQAYVVVYGFLPSNLRVSLALLPNLTASISSMVPKEGVEPSRRSSGS